MKSRAETESNSYGFRDVGQGHPCIAIDKCRARMCQVKPSDCDDVDIYIHRTDIVTVMDDG